MVNSSIARTNDIFKTIKGNIDILTVIERYSDIKLERRGKDFIGLCPFHQERTPSFTVSPEKGLFYCFGCGTGGDAVAFISQLYGLKPIEAANLIAKDFGLVVETRPLTQQERTRIREQQRKREYEKALERWATDSFIKLADLRRYLFYVLVDYEDYFKYPEFVFLLNYTDHLLDVLCEGTLADKQALLELHLDDKLGLAGWWVA